METKQEYWHFQGMIQGIVNHSIVEQLMVAAQSCDQAEDALRRGAFELALETCLPLVVLEVPVLTERARAIAIEALDELVEQCEAYEDFTTGLKYLNQWLSLKPHDFYPMVRKAEMLYLELEEWEASYRMYREVVKFYPNSVEAWIGLAQIEYRRHHYRRAMRYLIKAWQVLDHSEWAYPKTRKVITNVLASLYDVTAALLAITGKNSDAKSILTRGIGILQDSDFLQYRLQQLENIEEKHNH